MVYTYGMRSFERIILRINSFDFLPFKISTSRTCLSSSETINPPSAPTKSSFIKSSLHGVLKIVICELTVSTVKLFSLFALNTILF